MGNHSPQKYKRRCNSNLGRWGGAHRPRNAVGLSSSSGGGGRGGTGSGGQFIKRMQKVEDYMNSSSSFAACGGGRGLEGLARELRERCKEVKRRQGERIPK